MRMGESERTLGADRQAAEAGERRLFGDYAIVEPAVGLN